MRGEYSGLWFSIAANFSTGPVDALFSGEACANTDATRPSLQEPDAKQTKQQQKADAVVKLMIRTHV
jgi:hypothetical protein